MYGAPQDFAQLVRRDGVEDSPAMTMPTVIAPKDAGEADPVASNDSIDGKAQNRRVEVLIMPTTVRLVIPTLNEQSRRTGPQRCMPPARRPADR